MKLPKDLIPGLIKGNRTMEHIKNSKSVWVDKDAFDATSMFAGTSTYFPSNQQINQQLNQQWQAVGLGQAYQTPSGGIIWNRPLLYK